MKHAITALAICLTGCNATPERRYDKTILLVVETRTSPGSQAASALQSLIKLIPLPIP